MGRDRVIWAVVMALWWASWVEALPIKELLEAIQLMPEHRAASHQQPASSLPQFIGLPAATPDFFMWTGTDGSYRFGLQGRDQWRVESRNPEGVVSGRYYYRTPEGKEVDVSYDAGPKGYQARGEAIPGGAAPPEHQQKEQEYQQREQQQQEYQQREQQQQEYQQREQQQQEYQQGAQQQQEYQQGSQQQQEYQQGAQQQQQQQQEDLMLKQRQEEPVLQRGEGLSSPFGALLLTNVQETRPMGEGIDTFADDNTLAIVTDVKFHQQHLSKRPTAVFPVVVLPGSTDEIAGPPLINDQPVLPGALLV
ncbi:hypothetical protein Pmani_027018 [Petrolisthes manimaculis]|uniref:Uncharacterized protein n=1 Tax=Petrolisthes manimaculis TaxID=1843537 RepID=A0AAE1P514_9EUCA|nr:hypothetical protein Pmani_027018 [Petrolisthes manimaculis]